MAAPNRKRSYVPSELDRRRASEVRRKADELGQPTVARVMDVSVRTLQRYIKLERAMRASDVDRFEQHFGKVGVSPLALPPPRPSGAPSALESVLARYEAELSLKQANSLRALESSGLHLTEGQWEQVVVAMVNAPRPQP